MRVLRWLRKNWIDLCIMGTMVVLVIYAAFHNVF